MANSQQTIRLGSGAELEFDNLLQENGDKLLTEDGLAFLALESGGGLTFHSTELVGEADYSSVAQLVGRYTLTIDLANSEQVVVLPSLSQTVKTGGPNSSQNIRLTR